MQRLSVVIINSIISMNINDFNSKSPVYKVDSYLIKNSLIYHLNDSAQLDI